MLSLSSQLINQRVFHLLRFNFIKRLQTNQTNATKATKLDKTLNFKTINGFQEKLNRLETSMRRIGKITVNDVNQCLNELSKSRRVRPTTSQSLLLIRCCGAVVSDVSPEKRKDLCQRLFETLSETTDLDVSHYNQMLRVFVDNEFDFNVIEFLEKMQSKAIEPNRVTFVLMIDRFCRTANVSEAVRIIDHMKSKDMPISESVFNSLVIGFGKAGDMKMAVQTLDWMRSSGIEPTADTYTALLCAYAFNIESPESEEKINELLNEMKEKEINFSEINVFKVIQTIALVNPNSKLLTELLERVKTSVNYNKECLNVINELLFAGKLDIALKIYDTMSAPEIQIRNKSVGNPLIRAMIRAGIAPKLVIEFCEKLETEGKNEFAIRIATDLALSDANVSDCRTYLKRFSRDQPLRVHYFYPVLIKCQTEDEILEVLGEDMSGFCGANYSQLSELFLDYIWPKNIINFEHFMEKCKTIGFSFSITYNSLIRHLISNNRFEDVFQLMSSPAYSTVNFVKRDLISTLSDAVLQSNPKLREITKCLQMMSRNPQRFARSTEVEPSDNFGNFLLTLNRKRISSNLFYEVLKTFDEMSVKLSEGSVNALKDRITFNDKTDDLLTKLKTKSFDDQKGFAYHDFDDITRPRREMTSEELESHLVELRSKGMNTRGVLRSLLMAYCRRTKFSDDLRNDVLVNESRNRVKQIIDELNESNYDFSNAMNAMLMEFFVNCGDIESALEAKNKIAKEFEIDCYKVFSFATLYVRSGEIDKAIDFIKNEYNGKPDAIEGEESNVQLIRYKDMSIFRLLSALIDAKVEYKLLKQVFELCIDYSSMTPTAVMAGPLVKYHIMKEDYTEALNEYLSIVEDYRITPWKNQLIRHFLEKGDQMSLQKVIDSSNRVHGEMNTIMELAAICIEVGKTRQAKKLLDTPGLKVRAPKIDTICEQFVREDKISELEELIRCSRNVFDLNRDRMLFHLIKACIKQENPQKALNCWTLMQEEDIQPSDQTLIFLANYLQQNNITVPFSVPPMPASSQPLRESKSEDQTSGPMSDALLHKFNEALKQSDVEEALKIKKTLESEGKALLMSQNCSLIELLLNSNRIPEAFELSESLLMSKLFPSPRVIRFLFSKLCQNGDYERLEKLRPILPEFMIQNNSYTNSLSIAYINSGKTDELIDNNLLQMKPFPLGGFLRALEVRPDLEDRLLNIANQLVTESDFHLPLNMVWINCMKKERFEDAKVIYDSCPKLKDFLLFSSLLDSIRENQNIVLAQNLIKTLSDSNLTSKSIGVAYSALIDVYVETGQTSVAEDVVINEIINNTNTRMDPKSGTAVKVISIEHLNRSTINRLNKAIRETEQREPKFQFPLRTSTSIAGVVQRGQTSSLNASSDDSSSDEEVIDFKNKH